VLELSFPSGLFRLRRRNRYTSAMDSVRFGRALGFGARSAAKALITAVDAATAPNPNAPTPSAGSPRPAEQPPQQQRSANSTASASAQPPRAPQPTPTSRPIVENAARAAAQAQAHARQASKGVAAGSKQFGKSVWRPFVKLSGVLWLEITGSFFALIAFFTGESLWVHRADVHANPLNPTAHEHFLVYLVVTVMFSWFAVSSFLRARRRSRSS
jgi:hypothetical protein